MSLAHNMSAVEEVWVHRGALKSLQDEAQHARDTAEVFEERLDNCVTQQQLKVKLADKVLVLMHHAHTGGRILTMWCCCC